MIFISAKNIHENVKEDMSSLTISIKVNKICGPPSVFSRTFLKDFSLKVGLNCFLLKFEDSLLETV